MIFNESETHTQNYIETQVRNHTLKSNLLKPKFMRKSQNFEFEIDICDAKNQEIING